MKERPVIFSGPMVRAILEGRKTQTRRIVKPAPVLINGDWRYDGEDQLGRSVYWWAAASPANDRFIRERCPYGAPGDRLWVRESFCQESFFEPCACRYKADGVEPFPKDGVPGGSTMRWRPSIHMPRWASRITLEVTGVRVERLQEISEEDAKAEGPEPWDSSPLRWRIGFERLWDSINAGRAPWASNPWVWVVEFRRLP